MGRRRKMRDFVTSKFIGINEQNSLFNFLDNLFQYFGLDSSSSWNNWNTVHDYRDFNGGNESFNNGCLEKRIRTREKQKRNDELLKIIEEDRRENKGI